MKIYKVYTENKNRKFIEKLFNEEFSGFTIYEAIGYWQGHKEKSLVIEIISSSSAAPVKLAKIAKAICGYNEQDTVLVSEQEIDACIYGVSGYIDTL